MNYTSDRVKDVRQPIVIIGPDSVFKISHILIFPPATIGIEDLLVSYSFYITLLVNYIKQLDSSEIFEGY